ncbi:MAG: YvcK family protein [Chloroflexi bacterium]|nr:YvcK family protein [Chloroflexota bacterium]
MNFLKWLYPGMHVKRWLLLLLVGITLVSLGIAYLITHIYRSQPFPEYVGILTLQFIDRPIRGMLFVGAGAVVAVLAVLHFNRSLLSAFLPPGKDNIVDIVYQHRHLQRGPKVVALGGGTGLSTLLRGLKEYTGNLTAVVTVADDGGSSGRLRRELGILPPGDFRQCLVALSDVEPLMTKLFQYRFGEGTELEGHSFGNLFIVAMSAITGNFERAIRESSRVLAVRGQILPSTLADVTLIAELQNADLVRGESKIGHSPRAIKRLFLQPDRPPAYPEAIRAILDADLIVIGPGSLYTSILPNLLVEDITRAIKASSALKLYVCNVATQQGETDDFTVTDHITALATHVGHNLVNYVLANNNLHVQIAEELRAAPVNLDGDFAKLGRYKVVVSDVVDVANPMRHDPKKLAQSILRIYYDRTQPADGWATEVPEGAETVTT